MPVWLLGLGAIGGFIAAKLPSFEPEKYSRLWATLNRQRRDLLDLAGFEEHARIALLQELFRMTGDMGLVGPSGHPRYHKPGPHDEAALGTAATLFLSPQASPDAFEADVPTTGLFTTGSPVSSRLAAMVVPVVGTAPEHGFASIVNPKLVPYHFWMSDQVVLTLKSATQGGAERGAANHGLVTEGRLPWHPFRHTGRDGWLETDFLLLTVIPRNLDGARLTIASGAHGPGTGATALLLNPDVFRLSQLEDLVERVRGFDAFQVVFEVEVSHEGQFSAPRKLRVSEDCPPLKIECSNDLFTCPASKINEQFLRAILAEQSLEQR